MRRADTLRNAVTPYNQPIAHYNMPSVWATAKREANVAQLEAEARAFNHSSRWRKRGVALVPLKYGVVWYKSTAVVAADADGTVTIHHGMADVGQGIQTRISQVAAYELGCPIECIYVVAASTDAASKRRPLANR